MAKNKLALGLAASRQFNGNGGDSKIITREDFARIPGGIGKIIDHIDRLLPMYYSCARSIARIAEYEDSAIKHQLAVAGLPTPTIFQRIGAIFHQNYARERAAAVSRRDEGITISRGYTKSMGLRTRLIPDREIHAHNYMAAVSGFKETVREMQSMTLLQTQALVESRIKELEAYARNILPHQAGGS